MRPAKWLAAFFAVLALLLLLCGGTVAFIDPFFHYHAPRTDLFFYPLDNERCQNDGIAKHFDYNAVITGTSMAQNFKTSECDRIFGVRSVKTTSSGATFRETNDNLKAAFASHPDLALVIRPLDILKFTDDKDLLRNDLGEYPVWLYNRNPFDDVRYLLNRDILLNRCIPMLRGAADGTPAGITSFDEYGAWMRFYPGQFGSRYVLKNRRKFKKPASVSHLTDDEAEAVRENIKQNVTSLCKEHPETTFCYFITPYSAAFWGREYQKGRLEKRIETERIVLEEMLPVENLEVYSFSCMTDITGNLDNYKDPRHYGEWINTRILEMMHEGTGRLTGDNYEAYLKEEEELYRTFDYQALF